MWWNHNVNVGTDWGGRSTYRRYNTNANAQFRSFRNANVFLNLEQQDISKTTLRGGPRFRRPAGYSFGGNLSTDTRKDFVAFAYGGCGATYEAGVAGGYWVGADVQWQATDALQVYLGPNFEHDRRRDQYFNTVRDANGDPVYLHGAIAQQTLSLTLRATYNLTPDFTIQYYGQPFVARGVYEEFRYVTDAPLARGLDERLARFGAAAVSYDAEADAYAAVRGFGETGGSRQQSPLRFGNPDFHFLQFRSNLVVRWEYLPSSTLFLVWNQGVTGGADPETGVLSALGSDLFGDGVQNTFLVKATYRWVR